MTQCFESSLVHGFHTHSTAERKCQQDSTGDGDKPFSGSHKTDPERPGNSSRAHFKRLTFIVFLSASLSHFELSSHMEQQQFFFQIINVLDLNWAC